MAAAQAAVLFAAAFLQWDAVGAVTLKKSAPCFPACVPGHGLCIEGRCFCRTPYGGPVCEQVVGNDDDHVANPINATGTSQAAGMANPVARSQAAVPAPSGNGNENLAFDFLGSGDDTEEEATPDAPVAEQSSLQIESGDLSMGGQIRITDLPPHGDRVPDQVIKGNVAPAPIQMPAVSQEGVASDRDTRGWHHPRSSVPPPAAAAQMPPLPPVSWQVEQEGIPQQPKHHGDTGPVVQHRRHQEQEVTKLSVVPSEPRLSLAVLADTSDKVSDEACIPWLAEFRALDIHEQTGGMGSIDNMKMGRLKAFQSRAKGLDTLKKDDFISSVSKWKPGPSYNEIETLFSKLDTTGDGVLTFDEYNAENLCGFRRLLLEALAVRLESFENGFRLLDENLDGEISEDEFLAMVSGVLLGLEERDAKIIFKSADIFDGSPGKLTRTEFQILGGLPRLRFEVAAKEPDLAVAFKQADTNGDDNLDSKEFDAHAKEMGSFTEEKAAIPAKEELDRNGDGKIEKSEYVNKCWTSTGGRCTGVGFCPQWRGPTTCVKSSLTGYAWGGYCTCAPGYCAKNGLCIPEELHSEKDSPLGPDAQTVLKKMQDVDEDKADSGPQADINPASAVAALLLGVAVLMQLKTAMANFPVIGVLVFSLAVVAFFSVTITCFRAYSSPKTISNDAQTWIILMVFSSVTLSITSLVRVWSPDCSKTLIVCFLATDDREYGLDTEEEGTVRSYNFFMTSLCVVCSLGLIILPMDGVKTTQTKFIMIMLYMFIVVLDSWMSSAEVRACAARRLLWDLELSTNSEKHHAKLTCAVAWWSLFDNDEQTKISFGSYREKPDARGGAGRLMSLRDEQKLAMEPAENELIHLDPLKLAKVYYVRGCVVCAWEDSDLELVVPNGEKKAEDGTTIPNSTDWVRVDEVEDYQKYKSESGEYLCPWVRIGTVERAKAQSVAHKMQVVTQAGAAGLIIGQRVIGQLHTKVFHLPKQFSVTKQVWKGDYKLKAVKDADGGMEAPENPTYEEEPNRFERNVKKGKNHLKRAKNGKETLIEKGVAVNTVLINNLDMQELVWVLDERKAKRKADLECASGGATYGIFAVSCNRKKDLIAKQTPSMTSEVSKLEMEDEVETTDDVVQKKLSSMKSLMAASFKHVYKNQRQILSDVSKEPEHTMAFLINIRGWITEQWYIKSKVYPFIHLLLTVLGLNLVLEMSLQIYHSFNLNGKSQWAVMIFLLDLVNLSNTSYNLQWWPAHVWGPSGLEKLKNKPAQDQLFSHVGALLTVLVILQYSVGCVSLFVVHGILHF